jgi:hypothetical protein
MIEAMMILGGLMGIAALGGWHLGGLLLLKRIKPSGRERHSLAVMTTFGGLLLLHFSEIVWCTAMLKAALAYSDASTVTSGYGESTAGLLYLAGVTFTTLGYTGQSVSGPIRLVIMVQSLGGFMILTWSATFVYSLWEERFR